MAKKSGVNQKSINNLNPIHKGEVRNPKGRPRTTISQINQDLELMGYTQTTKAEIVEAYMRLVNIPKPRLRTISKDNNLPALITITAKALVGGKGFDIIEKILDRGIGKSITMLELNNSLAKKTASNLTFEIIDRTEQVRDDELLQEEEIDLTEVKKIDKE